MHPSAAYLKFLMAQNWGADSFEYLNEVSVSKLLQHKCLLPLQAGDWDDLLAEFKPPKTFRFNDHSHGPTASFMRKHKLESLWRSDPEAMVAMEITDRRRRMKSTLHILLMGEVDAEFIADKLTKKYRVEPALTAKVINEYRRYFWDPDNASDEEWVSRLANLSYGDALLASLQHGQAQALYRAGFSIQVKAKTALKEALSQAYYRLQALRSWPEGKQTIQVLGFLTSRIIQIHEILDADGVSFQDQLREFKQLALKHQDPQITPITALVDREMGGSYSRDGEDPVTQ